MLHRQAADQMEELDRLRVQVEELTEQRDRLHMARRGFKGAHQPLVPVLELPHRPAGLGGQRPGLRGGGL